MQSFSGLPPALRQKAANLATWFPEVLAISGAPEEENFSGAHLHVSESPTCKTLEVILPKKKQPQNPEALGQGVQERLERLDRLAADFESLASQLQTLNSAAMRLQREAEESSMGTRLDAATDELLNLTEILKANPLKAAPLPNDLPNEGCSLPPAEAESAKGPGTLHVAQAPREARPSMSPRSARGRGGQAQQGGWSQRNLGAGRSRANKAEWKDKLKIEVTKVREMPQSDPKSPKGKAPAQVWGTTIPPQPLRRGDTLTPSSMQARIEQKLTMVLGQGRRPERTRTLPASAFPSAFQSQLAEFSGKKKPASAEDLSSSSG